MREAGREAQLALIRAHPELAGKAMVSKTLTAESTNEQGKAGLTDCTPEEFAKIQQLNADYNAQVRLPLHPGGARAARHRAWPRREIIDTFERRLDNHPDFELAESLRNIHRIAEIRLNDKFGVAPDARQPGVGLGRAPGRAQRPGLRRARPAHRHLPDRRAPRLRAAAWRTGCGDCGFDEVEIDAVGNVVGVYHGSDRDAKRLLTGTTTTPCATAASTTGGWASSCRWPACANCTAPGKRLPFGFEVVGFAEEEGQRYKATFLGSGALTGHFDPSWLEQKDADGVTHARGDGARRPVHRRHPEAAARPGQATWASSRCTSSRARCSTSWTCRWASSPRSTAACAIVGEVIGMASHAGTTPMDRRRDAAAAVAELVLYRREARRQRAATWSARWACWRCRTARSTWCPAAASSAWTSARPPTRCATPASTTCCAELARICERRGLRFKLEETDARRRRAQRARPGSSAGSARSQPLGLPLFRMPSGAGHDAMKLHEVMPQAMLFVRGLNAGISHNPLESITNDDTELACAPSRTCSNNLATETAMTKPPTKPRRLDRRPFRRGGAVPAGAGARAHRHAAGQQRAARRAHGRAAAGLRLRGREAPGAGAGGQGLRPAVDHQPDRAPAATAQGRTIALNAHGDVVPPGEGWTHDPYGGEIVDGKLYGRASAVSKSDFATYTFAVRALEVAAGAAEGRRRAALHLRRGIRRRARPGLAAEATG